MNKLLSVAPLNKRDFLPFGEVIETDGAQMFAINQGYATRYNNLAAVDVTQSAGSTNVSIVSARARRPELTVMERHPLGSQLFFPLQDRHWLIAVCADPAAIESYRVFSASGQQGINYFRNTWHHPLLVTEGEGRFFVVDRKGEGNNLEEMKLPAPLPILWDS